MVGGEKKVENEHQTRQGYVTTVLAHIIRAQYSTPSDTVTVYVMRVLCLLKQF